MYILNYLPFFKDGATTESESEELSLLNGCSSASIEVRGDGDTFSITVSAVLDQKNEDEWTTLTYINESYDTGKAITSNGIYTFAVGGIARIKAEITAIGSGTIIMTGKAGK